MKHSKVIFEKSIKYYKWCKYLLSKYSMFLFFSDKFGFFSGQTLQSFAGTGKDLLRSPLLHV